MNDVCWREPTRGEPPKRLVAEGQAFGGELRHRSTTREKDSVEPQPQVLGAAELVIPPGQSHAVDVIHSPRAQLSTLGPLVVRSNDPLNPAVEVPLSADIRTLAFQSQLIAVSPELPLGEAATVVVTSDAQVHVESGFVFDRAHGASTFADSSVLVAQGSNFAVLIPGRDVTEAGLEHYVRVENSGVFAFDPPGAPASHADRSSAAPVAQFHTTVLTSALQRSCRD